MLQHKFKDENILQEKIHDLFEYRKLYELIRLAGLEKDKLWISHLNQIQTQIYHLDAYLESAWELDREKLSMCWEGIYKALAGLGYSAKKSKKLLKEIRMYEKIEMQCRQNKWPTRVSMDDFYTTKSCDVRLIRHLIYEAAPEISHEWHESTWRYYDLITEINDDVSDVFEDLQTYNGNRYLISVLRKGAHRTNQKYHDYISGVVRKANRFFKHHPKQEHNRKLHDWIIQRSKETQSLLVEMSSRMHHEQLGQSLLLQQMK